jgi:hypothetical protein
MFNMIFGMIFRGGGGMVHAWHVFGSELGVRVAWYTLGNMLAEI